MNTANYNLKEMKTTIEQIEELVLKLKASGAGIPAVEKNAMIILSFVAILKYGISDPADLMD